jgi:hypothetical protein
MKRIALMFLALSLASSVHAQTKMFINRTNGTDSLLLSEIRSITFRTTPSVPVEGLVAYYSFSGNADDASGNGNNGTLAGSAQLVADKRGNASSACSFNGSSSYVDVPNSTSLQLATNKFTFTLWFNTTASASETAPFLSKNNSTSDLPQYTLVLNPIASIHCGITDTTNTMHWADKDFAFQTGHWYFLAATWDGDSARVFVNDSLVSTTKLKYKMKVDSHPLALGRDTGGTIDYYKGVMDEIRIYNRALSRGEILGIYQSY